MNKKRKINTNMSYSKLIAWLSFTISVYTFILLYIESSFLWLLVGSNNILILLTLINSSTHLEEYLSKYINVAYIRFLFIMSSITLFLSSVFGTYKLFIFLNLKDYSILLIPSISLLFLYGGSCLGIYQTSNIEKPNK